jgi:hypothetical protein
MGLIGEIWADAKLHVDKASFSEYGSMLKQAEGQVSGFSDGTKAALATAFMVPAAAVTGIAAYGASIAASYEDANLTLKTLYGSQEAAQQKFQWLADFAATTPFDFPELLEAATRLKAFGMDIEQYGRTVGDTAAAMGKPIMAVVEALADAQQGEFERMKEFGIKAVEIQKNNYQQLGASMQDIGKTALTYMDANGKQQIAVVDRNNKEMITSTIEAIWNSKYAGAMEERSKSFNGMISTIKDNLKAGLAELVGFDMTTGLAEAGSLYSTLQDLAKVAIVVSGAFSNMSEPMQTFVLVATLGGTAALAIAGGLIAYSMAVGLATPATIALVGSITAALWPAALVVIALAAIAAGLVYLNEKTGIITYSWNLLKDLFTITVDGILRAAGILKDYIVNIADDIKTAILDMFPAGFLESVSNVVNGIISQFTNMGNNIHTQAEGIRQDNANIGTSAQTAGGQVTTATGQMQTGFFNAGMSALGMGTNTLTATGQMVGGFNAAGGAATTMGGNVAGTVPSVNALTVASYSGVTANQAYAASFVDVSNMANEAANAAISAANRIGSAIKTNISQVGELEALAGKWNTRAKLGIDSSGGSGTGEGNVKVIAAPKPTLTKTDPTSQSGWSVKINTVNNYGNSTSTTKTKSAV